MSALLSQIDNIYKHINLDVGKLDSNICHVKWHWFILVAVLKHLRIIDMSYREKYLLTATTRYATLRCISRQEQHYRLKVQLLIDCLLICYDIYIVPNQ